MSLKREIWDKIYLHRYGIMGTVIFHLVVGIFLLGMGISKMNPHTGVEIHVEIPTPEEIREQKEEKIRQEELHKRNVEEEVNNMLRATVSNAQATNRSKQQAADVQRYIDEVMDELNRQGGEGLYSKEQDKHYKQDSIQYIRDQQRLELDSLKSTFYSGESSVTYSLTNRFARYLPIPVFKCEFGGKVMVSIVVNRKGIVQKATVESSSSQQDECLSEVAVDAALRSRFNENPNAPASQTGTITYIFVKQ